MSHASTFAAGELPIRVLTFNLWGIFNSRMREARMKVFATKIEHYDVILLQEQFSVEDFDLIFQHASPAVQRTYTFRRFCSSFYGSGCAVISRYPISQAFFHTFPLQGYPEMVLHGDFFANKGAAMVRVMVPVTMEDGSAANAQEVTLYTTHLVAVYEKVSQLSSWKRERYLPFRISQAISFADFIVSTSRPTDRIIIGGDFNCSQRSLEVQMMLILLKRYGYDMHSVLPPPRALRDAATAEQEREGGQRFFTYSDSNTFNSMKTSYFKLLKLEADIPSQIDHIFFSRPAFALRQFADCPDVADGYPCALQDAPNGLVVFTKNEVHVPPHSAWCRSLWHQLLTGKRVPRGANATGQLAKPGRKTASSTEGQSADDAAHYYPMSDHFGVAALLGMRVEKAGSTTAMICSSPETGGTAALALTPDEARAVQTVVDFLEDYVCKLRSQAKTTRYMAVFSLLLVAANIWVLRRLSAKEEARSAAVLERIYDMAAATTRDTAKVVQPGNGLESIKHGFNVAKDWASNQAQLTLHIVSKFTGATPAPGINAGDTPEGSKQPAANVADPSEPVPRTVPASTGATTAKRATSTPEGDAAARPDFRAIAEALTVRPLYASAWVSSAFNMTAAVVGTVSFAIGVFQRAGNANILEEQVHQLKKL
ncbi:inositol phosphosphingolipid phospholipase C-Like [Leishmania donovani]|uniref:Inositol phosphosphingolipid phospholipase C-Like n=1 Tax=Leishmania donovani TaxID=5661 RepID=A0A3S5H634_LEIDO|nr:inositol phosphosphingolipid phospholipase C-Like [Leishmania donovani]